MSHENSGASAAVTVLLRRWSGGDHGARDEVLPLVYGELRQLAQAYLRRERQGHTLETSGLIHEAFLRLIGQQEVSWQNRKHFFGIAAQCMRRILVDHARHRGRSKRGGDFELVGFDEAWQLAEERPGELLALDEALGRLAEVDPERARLVELRFFGGLTHEEIADLLGISLSTVERRWRLARAFLYDAMAES
jgi:RNA polymerase sigma factor (TIGR02999 family)